MPILKNYQSDSADDGSDASSDGRLQRAWNRDKNEAFPSSTLRYPSLAIELAISSPTPTPTPPAPFLSTPPSAAWDAPESLYMLFRKSFGSRSSTMSKSPSFPRIQVAILMLTRLAEPSEWDVESVGIHR